MRHATSALLAVLLCASAASAQPTAPPPAPKKSSVGVHGFATIDASTIASPDSFDAVFGKTATTAFGGGGEIVDLWKHLFVRIAASRTELTGNRVFVDSGTAYNLGIPLTVKMTPVEGGAGWRFVSRSRLTPYIGGAFVSLGYEETTDFAGSSDNLSDRFKGGAVFGGVDFNVWKGIVVGAEGQLRSIMAPDAAGGAMKAFGENDLGGFTGRITIGFTTK